MSKKVIPNDDMMALIIELINQKQKATFKVVGNSMYPFLKHQETSVTVEKIQEPVKKGDIVLFSYHQKYILHRVIQVKQDQIICQGDALFSKEMIQEKDLIGVVTKCTYKDAVVPIQSRSYRFKVKLWRLIKPVAVRIRSRLT